MASSTPAALTPGQRLRRLPGALQQNTRNIQTSVRVVATAGQAGDCPQALVLLAGLDTQMVIADTS